MKCYTQFYAQGYSVPYPDDYQTFDSLQDVMGELQARMDFRKMYPCLEYDAHFLVWLGKPEGQFPCDCDCYPDRKVYFGPRKAIKIERV